LALSNVTSASNPIRTKEVFSFTPVTSAARRRMRSSMFSVVLMHISMPHEGIKGNAFFHDVSAERYP
jgi:hypothetical protein